MGIVGEGESDGDLAAVGGVDAVEPESLGGRDSPLRRCIVTGTVAARSGMIRFIVGPDERVSPDLSERLPGRGYWVTADRAVLDTAIRKRQFARAVRRAVTVPEDLLTQVEIGLKRRCLAQLGLARRAGQLVVGYEQVRDALTAGKVVLRIEAADGAAEGRDKLTSVRPEASIAQAFSASELAEALGRAHLVHAAVTHGGFADRFLVDFVRYAGVVGMAWEPGLPGRGGILSDR